MGKFKKVDVSEQRLEDLVRGNADLIEEGLVYVDHQKPTTGGRLDVLLVDSGKALVVAELKVAEDDGMLLQAIDYYDYVSTHIEAYARLYKNHSLNPTQQVRLFLIAPSFSQAMTNRCKWIDIPISLFTFACLKFEGKEDIVLVPTEQDIPPVLEAPEAAPQMEDHLGYIVDKAARSQAASLLSEMKTWNPGITMDAIKGAISIKVNGRVLAYVYPRRNYFGIGRFTADDKWGWDIIHDKADLDKAIALVKATLEKRCK